MHQVKSRHVSLTRLAAVVASLGVSLLGSTRALEPGPGRLLEGLRGRRFHRSGPWPRVRRHRPRSGRPLPGAGQVHPVRRRPGRLRRLRPGVHRCPQRARPDRRQVHSHLRQQGPRPSRSLADQCHHRPDQGHRHPALAHGDGPFHEAAGQGLRERGNISKMEPQRGDDRVRASCTGWAPVPSTTTTPTSGRGSVSLGIRVHRSADRARPAICVRVTPRVNIGNDQSPDFVVRDSSQVATRVLQASCGPDFTNNLGLSETRDHCGAMSIWDVASGGRLGMVTGEDATEVANPPTACTQNCQAQNRVRGRAGHPRVPVPGPGGQPTDPAHLHRRAERSAHALTRGSRRPARVMTTEGAMSARSWLPPTCRVKGLAASQLRRRKAGLLEGTGLESRPSSAM